MAESNGSAQALPLMEELRVAEAAARAASAIIMERRPGILQLNEVQQKSGGEGPVTEADLAADRSIRERVAEAFPADVIITEETFSTLTELPASGRVWMVDPLDGTKCFIDPESNDFCVMVGLCIDGEAVLGVIMEPATGNVWKGVSHDGRRGAWRHRGLAGAAQPMAAFSGQLGPELRFGTGPPLNPRFAPLVSKWIEQPAVAFAKGSAGLKAMQIVDGVTDMYTSSFNKISLWDICAAHAIVAAVGGSLCTLKLTPINYSCRYLTDGLFFHQPGVDLDKREKVVAMYRWLAEYYSSGRARV